MEWSWREGGWKKNFKLIGEFSRLLDLFGSHELQRRRGFGECIR